MKIAEKNNYKININCLETWQDDGDHFNHIRTVKSFTMYILWSALWHVQLYGLHVGLYRDTFDYIDAIAEQAFI